MKFDRVFIERELIDSSRVSTILEKLSYRDAYQVDSYEEVFQARKKPYLDKRESLNLFLAKKKGALVKEAPDAYGVEGDPHYYFFHTLNCIYECQYCYLQGYFDSPDIVVFLNFEEIAKEIDQIAQREISNGKTPWFHAGEFGDSLALSNFIGEWPYYIDLFRKLPQARLELRTKSANVRPLLEIEAPSNVVVSFSMSDPRSIKEFDFKTPSFDARFSAIKRLVERGYQIGIHLDPMIMSSNLSENYSPLLECLRKTVPQSMLSYISLGMLRFSKDSFKEFSINYPESEMLDDVFVSGEDGKIRYPRLLRQRALKAMHDLCRDHGFANNKLYFCME